MMQNLDTFIEDRLRHPGVTSDVHPGTALSRTGFDWARHARRQTSHLHQRATIVFLGALEGTSMRTREGNTVDCCGDPWVSEYSARASRVMRAFGGGERKVYWYTLPAPRRESLRQVYAAVNAGLRRAAGGRPNVRLLALDDLLTPGFVYRRTTVVDGRRVPMHEQDGIHLSVPVSSLAAWLAVRAVRADL
jgi:hypothetical protein